MAIIGNPWAQDAAAFGQGVGQNLSQGLLQLPQQRYALAMQQEQLQRALQQMAMTQQYHQGLLGLRQQGLENQGQARDMANQIALLRAQMEGQHYGNQDQYNMQRLGQPRVEGGYLIPGVGQGQPQQNESPDWGPTGNTPPQGLGQTPQATGLPQDIQQLSKQATPPPQISQNQLGDQFLKATTTALGMYGTNAPVSNPALWNSFTNFQATGRVPQGWGGQVPQPQTGGAGVGQATTNQLQQAAPVQTNSIPPQAVQLLRTNPALRGAFDQKYGQGASNQFLGQ
jgi:hypothetical protein